MTQGLLASVDEAIELLERDGRHLVLKKFAPRERYAEPLVPMQPGQVMLPPLHRGLFVDNETNGLGPDAKIIEFAAVPFEFSHDGQIFGVGEPYQGYEDPGAPLPEEIVELTGITDEMVKGHRLDDAKVHAMIGDAQLVIAHQADFDRPLVDRRFPISATKAYACSRHEVPWEKTGHGSGTKLEWLLYANCREYSDAHSALEDSLVGVHLLASVMIDRRLAMAHLLNSARQDTVRLWATGSAFTTKDKLNERGYRWSASKKCWAIDITTAEEAEEREWLAGIIGVQYPERDQFNAKKRYSEETERVFNGGAR